MRVGGRFAGEVPGVELFEGGVDVVEVEHDDRRDLSSASISTDVEDLVVERLGSLVSTRVAGTSEDEVRAASRNDSRRHVGEPDVGGRSHIFDLGIPTLSDPGVHDPPAIVDGNVVGQCVRHGVQSRAAKHVQIALGHLACRIFQPRRR